MNTQASKEPKGLIETDNSFALEEPKLRQLLELAQTNQVQSILEFGSGQSTAAFCRVLKDAQVVSVESSAYYMEATRQLCESVNTPHQDPTLIHLPIQWQRHSKRLYLSYALSKLPQEIQTKRFDLCFIDGPVQNHTLAGREYILYKVFDRLSEGAIIVVDDAHRNDSKVGLQNWLRTFDRSLEVVMTQPKLVVLRKTKDLQTHQALGSHGWFKHHLKIPKVIYKTMRYSTGK